MVLQEHCQRYSLWHKKLLLKVPAAGYRSALVKSVHVQVPFVVAAPQPASLVSSPRAASAAALAAFLWHLQMVTRHTTGWAIPMCAARGSRGSFPLQRQPPEQPLFGRSACFAGARSGPGARGRSVPRVTRCFYLSILFHNCVEAILGVALAPVVTSDTRRAEDLEQKTQNSAEAYGVLWDIFKSVCHMTF